ncbi:hypothetical protein [Streptomyces sp. NPDC056682]|uniref:hypothetical protein n=1 Tax=Streptomyces sp. NPDC056682 TaxID=3345909 RepID=UPI00369928A8
MASPAGLAACLLRVPVTAVLWALTVLTRGRLTFLIRPLGAGWWKGAAMSRLVSCPPAPGPLERFAARFVFRHLAQRRGFREYLAGLLTPWERNKTLTCLAGTEPVVGSKGAAVQRLQYFLSKSRWEVEAQPRGVASTA